MKKKLLIVSLAAVLCLGNIATVSAAPAESPAPVIYTTVATPTDLALMRQIFNAQEYAEMYPDVVKALGTDEDALWEHFVTHGLYEGRSLSKSFNVFAYIAAYKDLRDAFGNDLVAYYVHYVNHGIQEKRDLVTIGKVLECEIPITGIRGQLLAEPPVRDNNSSEPAPATSPAPAVTPAPTPVPTSTPIPEPTAVPVAPVTSDAPTASGNSNN